MPTCPVSIWFDVAFQLPTTGHNFAPAPPPAPPPTPAPAATCWELPATQLWPTGFGTHKQTKTVTHKKQAICLDGHDIGRFVVHVPISPGPNNALLPMIMFKASRKNNFKAATVKMNGTATGTFIMINFPPMPMTSCAEPIAYPTACSTTSWTNNVVVGMTWASYLISALTLAANILVDRYLLKRAAALKKTGFADEINEMRKIKLLGGLMTINDITAVALKSVVAAASSVARLALTNEDGSFPLLAGAPFGVEITRTADGKYGVKGSATLTKGNTSATVAAAVSEDGAVDGSAKVTHKSKDGSKDAYGQDASNEMSAGVSGKRDAKGKTEVAGSVSAKDSVGNEESGSIKQTSDPTTGKTTTTSEISQKDALGTERKGTHETSENAKTGEKTDKVGVSGKSAAGSAEASTTTTTDATGQGTETTSGSVTPTGMEKRKAESKSPVYPTAPQPERVPLQLNNGERIA
jgi:hypothetical protein